MMSKIESKTLEELVKSLPLDKEQASLIQKNIETMKEEKKEEIKRHLVKAHHQLGKLEAAKKSLLKRMREDNLKTI